jgi:type IV secretory pathway ATPase VirB11/archaellum biosynthesis ATPase
VRRLECAQAGEGDRMNSEGIRVLIADDHAVLRAGLRLLLDAQPDMVVVGEAETAETAIMLDAA